MATQRGTCFVWIATPEDYDPQRFLLLQNMIYLAKYKTKMDRCVGIAHTLRRDGNIEPGLGRKPFAFPSESLFAFSPESFSPSPRNRFRVHPGILFALPRNPQPDSRSSDASLEIHPNGGTGDSRS
jgi:hypothetical protein